MVKQQILNCDIVDLLHDGRGVGRIKGKAYFVEGGLPGESVEFQVSNEKRNYAEGRVRSISVASEHRVEPNCKHFSRCGGCSLQHLDNQQQIEFKQNQVLNSFERASVKPESLLKPLSGSQWGYRRRARLAVQRARDGQFIIGFRNPGSRRIEPITECLVLDKPLAALLIALPQWLKLFPVDIAIFEIELVSADNAIAIALDASRRIKDDELAVIAKGIQSLSEASLQLWWKVGKNGQFRRLDRGTEQLYLRLPGNLKFYFEPGQFIQVNGDINAKMVDQMLRLVSPSLSGVAVDLFCGTGNLSLPLSAQFNQVIGVEGLDSLVVGAAKNALENEITNTQFFTADLTKENSLNQIKKIPKLLDLVVLDPPRSGALDVMPWVANSGAKQVIYISCHPSTMARDAKYLLDAGYKITNLGVLDMFPHTAHVEAMALFEK
jgi:23S rRNA (uracil1939-C5)-methyltransferase